MLYGLPDNETQIPDHFLADIGFWNLRTGGAQLPSGCRGWTYSYDDFLCRMESAMHNYRTARRFGANVQILLHDLWGIDGYDSVAAIPTPGDNGDWTSYNDFLSAIFQIFQANDVIDGIYFDITNEIDNTLYYERGMDRNEFPNGKSVGPSFGHLPDRGAADWYSGWASFIKSNNSIPEWMTMHFLEADGDLVTSISAFDGFLSNASISYDNPYVLNEYGNIDQQVPSGAAWNIAQMERNGAFGLRSNWRGDYELHDYLANLIGKTDVYPNYDINDADYWPCREYPVYQYYYQNMTGYRVRTKSTDDTLGDSYVVVGDDRVRILTGVRPSTGTWGIVLSGLSAVGLPENGQLPIQTWRFDSGDLYTEIDGPTNLDYYTHEYTDDTLYFVIAQDDANVAYAFEFAI
ncbi:hypothetical protein N7462_011484 [Penicillium macrosclerotiorum]|uniref:uncharacterized protein n=1 Tax=Penicillium macrosclerotiorum TaxID=303699 RepID=UPI00254911F3|nr:uncharacterized protein N7462_011484 [Penicillium macrosclerotiorum]KAJ5664671.1 hypothetical protein N7462_011484 [Penicillium macrosclerotiorum]